MSNSLIESLATANVFPNLLEDRLRIELDTDVQCTLAIKELNLAEQRHIKVEKHLLDFKQDDHHWIGLILTMPDMEPHHYLIPTSIFNEPDEYVFFSHDIKMLPKLSNWEIKVFGKGMARLSEFAFSNQVHKMK